MTTITARPRVDPLFRTAAVLWVIWGIVHMFAGIATIGRATPEAVQGIADDVEPETLELDYPDAVGAIVNQHGFNLLWIGAVTLMCAWFIWRRSLVAVLLAALVGGFADIGYFIFLDLGGYVKFLPGTLMTIFFWDRIYNNWLAGNLLLMGPMLLGLCLAMLGLMAVMLFVWRHIKLALFR